MEALNDYVKHLRATMPQDIREHAYLATASLYRGPIYLDEDGEECSCFDEGARPHDFRRSCEIVKDWAHGEIEDLYEDELCEDEEGELIEYPVLIADSSDIIRALFGRELARYL